MLKLCVTAMVPQPPAYELKASPRPPQVHDCAATPRSSEAAPLEVWRERADGDGSDKPASVSVCESHPESLALPTEGSEDGVPGPPVCQLPSQSARNIEELHERTRHKVFCLISLQFVSVFAFVFCLDAFREELQSAFVSARVHWLDVCILFLLCSSGVLALLRTKLAERHPLNLMLLSLSSLLAAGFWGTAWFLVRGLPLHILGVLSCTAVLRTVLLRVPWPCSPWSLRTRPNGPEKLLWAVFASWLLSTLLHTVVLVLSGGHLVWVFVVGLITFMTLVCFLLDTGQALISGKVDDSFKAVAAMNIELMMAVGMFLLFCCVLSSGAGESGTDGADVSAPEESGQTAAPEPLGVAEIPATDE